MAKKRDLKRTINYICSDLFAEGVAAGLYNADKADENTLHDILSTVIVTRNDFVKRISHPEPGMKPKVYYKHLIKDFNERINEVIDNISNVG